jgi:hypothetical protein
MGLRAKLCDHLAYLLDRGSLPRLRARLGANPMSGVFEAIAASGLVSPARARDIGAQACRNHAGRHLTPRPGGYPKVHFAPVVPPLMSNVGRHDHRRTSH